MPAELLAGVTLAALAIPEVMGYSKIAGMPVITGLYTMLVPLAVFAVLASSRHLVVGADSATAAIMAAGLARLALPGSKQYVALAGLVALLTAGMLIVARLVRLGFLAHFLSRTVLVGFLAGVGIQVASGQLPGMLGLSAGGGGTLRRLWHTLRQVEHTSTRTLAVSAAVLAVILGTRYVTRAVPGALLAVVGAIAVSWAVDLQAHGVAVVGAVPGGLPSFSFPASSHWRSSGPTLAATAFSIFIVVLAQSSATSRAYATKYGERFDEDLDLVALGTANLAAGLSGTFVVNGSPTKTQMVDSAGGRSQLASLVTAGLVGIVLLFLTRPLRYLPEAALGSIVFLIGLQLVSLRGLREIYRLRREEFVLAAVTAALVVAWGVKQGIVLAVVLAMIDHLRRSYNPREFVLVQAAPGHWAMTPAEPGKEAAPGLVVYRFVAGLYYANADRFSDRLLAIAARSTLPPRQVCVDAVAISDVDYSAGQMLCELQRELAKRGISLVFAEVTDAVRAQLDRYGVSALVGAAAFFPTLEAALTAFRAEQGS